MTRPFVPVALGRSVGGELDMIPLAGARAIRPASLLALTPRCPINLYLLMKRLPADSDHPSLTRPPVQRPGIRFRAPHDQPASRRTMAPTGLLALRGRAVSLVALRLPPHTSHRCPTSGPERGQPKEGVSVVPIFTSRRRLVGCVWGGLVCIARSRMSRSQPGCVGRFHPRSNRFRIARVDEAERYDLAGSLPP